MAVARQIRASHRFPPPTLAMTSTSQLQERVQSLLRPDVDRSRVGPMLRWVAASLVLLVGLGCAAVDAAKQDPPHPVAEPAEDVASAATDRGAQERPIELAIDASGEVLYAGKRIGVSGVRTLVARLADGGQRRVKVVYAKAVQAAVLRRVIDEAKLGGAAGVSIAAESDGQDGQGEPVLGVVLDADFDTPLANARIELVETGASTETSQTGAFRLRQPPGTYTLLVTKAGYFRQEKPVVVVDGRPTELRVQLRPFYVDQPPLEGR